VPSFRLQEGLSGREHGFEMSDPVWVIVHEHGSVPVDLGTGKPDLMSKP
jgi:hypothetical protein